MIGFVFYIRGWGHNRATESRWESKNSKLGINTSTVYKGEWKWPYNVLHALLVLSQLEQEHLQEQFEPDIIWNCPELDLIKPPFTESSFSDYWNQRRDSYSDLTSYLEEGDNNDVSQTVFKLDDVKPPEPHFFRPSSPQSQRTIDLPRPMLADTMEDVVGSGMFYSSPDMDLQLLDTSESTLEPLAVSSDVSVTFITNMFTADQQESPLERELRNDTILRLVTEWKTINTYFI